MTARPRAAGVKIAIELDGEITYTGPEVMAKQLARDADLEAEAHAA